MAIFINDSAQRPSTQQRRNDTVPGSPAPVGEANGKYGPYESDSEFKAMHLLVVLTLVVGILLLLESMVKAVTVLTRRSSSAKVPRPPSPPSPPKSRPLTPTRTTGHHACWHAFVSFLAFVLTVAAPQGLAAASLDGG